jgi:hypothetical protein
MSACSGEFLLGSIRITKYECDQAEKKKKEKQTNKAVAPVF